MGFARDIVRYARATSIDPFAEDAAALIQADPAAAALRSRGGDVVQRVLLTMQALHILRSEPPEQPAAEFVATLPAGTEVGARPTSVVVREMLSGPHAQVIALGYEISDQEFIARLHEAALLCPEIVLLCDRERRSARRLVETWPQDRHRPAVHQNIDWPDAAPLASMHCKALLVDGRDLLVTSANFTFHGLKGNIEFGVRLRGAEAQGARALFIQLLRSGLFERVEA
jgi:phosphatidylserine/phosphatidylglycerophosphate/cardiolipin synthase-like enzyme